jgi:hypothetical protein
MAFTELFFIEVMLDGAVPPNGKTVTAKIEGVQDGDAIVFFTGWQQSATAVTNPDKKINYALNNYRIKRRILLPVRQ